MESSARISHKFVVGGVGSNNEVKIKLFLENATFGDIISLPIRHAIQICLICQF